MVRIERIAIRGFQSHVDSLFNLAPGLTVVTGPSDAGKTAVIRALRWLAFNEPTGDAFLHTVRNQQGEVITQAEYAEVIVELEDGTVITKTRRKGKTSYTHSAFPEPWEKAEVPPEIKSALGLRKQIYGDNYETCLNFAFQLDPPFLLSEAGSVGAKVLGKLAGTEVVDRAIGAVTKSTHRTRDERARAEKRVGQLDVELLEYLEIDDKLLLLEAAEAKYDAVAKDVNTVDRLGNLAAVHIMHTASRKTAQERLQGLATVEVLLERLHVVNVNQGLHDTLVQLAARHTALHDDIDRERKCLDVYSVAVAKADALAEVERLQAKVEKLAFLAMRHTALSGDIDRERKCLEVYIVAVAKADAFAEVERIQAKAEKLLFLADQYGRAVQAVGNWTVDTEKLGAIDGLDEKLGAFDSNLQQITELQAVAQSYAIASVQLKSRQSEQQIATKRYADAEAEATAAWVAAGGVCPLCGQTWEGGADA